MHRTLVLNVVGLTPALLGDDTPHLNAFVAQGGLRPLATITPAVTCSVQATLLTGSLPREHGIVANGWYFRELAEVMFWRQSNQLVSGEKVWEAGKRRDPSFRCAKLFWWYNMYSSADLSVTPRPMYPADGRKLPDVYAEPERLRAELQRKLGTFPLFQFWGPGAGIVSSEWIARAAEHVEQEHAPTLSLVYLPHLDYCLQKFGPDAPEIAAQLRAVDAICGRLIEGAARRGQRVIVLSEYGIDAVSDAVHLNRALREAGLLRAREELGRELLDAGASQAFAVADHQLAHVYVRDPARVEEVRRLLARLDGVEQVLDAEGKRGLGLDHPRSGELVAISRPERWFSYYYWLDDARAPDFARTVEIHRKPGYDPVELFLDPALAFPKLRIARKLLLRKLGQRSLLDVIPLDTRLVRGSHGRVGQLPERGPLFATSAPELLPEGQVAATQVKELMLAHVFGPAGAPR
jgi:predicted AlkP superfamily pyrophosphatase or phosphodiesterase